MAMLAVVSLMAFCAIGAVSQGAFRTNITSAIDEALTDNGGFGLPELGNRPGGNRDDDEGTARRRSTTTPVYCVTVLDNGAYFAEENQGASMDSEVLADAVAQVLASGRDEGTLSDYELYYKVETSFMGRRIAFADMSELNETLGELVLGLAGLWLLLMAVLFVITVFLSRYVTKPVARAWEDQQRFIADASHELKTPLTVILADAAILSQHQDSTVREQSVWLEGISSEATRMQRLTEDMLTLAADDAGGRSMNLIDVDLSNVVQRGCLQFEAVAFERGLMIEEDVQDGIIVKGDSLRLENMLKTLLENACKYGADSGTIDVKLASQKGHAVLSVSNPGRTIDPEELSHLFDRFYKSDKARAREGESASFGLGLSIVKSTAEAHGGNVSAASTDGQTTFTVHIPLA